jgi:hypothetical protein
VNSAQKVRYVKEDGMKEYLSPTTSLVVGAQGSYCRTMLNSDRMSGKETAMIELTETQRQAIATAQESPPTVIDPQTRTAYVLIRREVYERLKSILDEDDVRLMAPLLAALDPEDWEDASAYEGKP